MKIKRRNFIKRSFAVLISTILLPPFFLNRLHSFGKSKPVSSEFKPSPETWKSNEINIAWIGHSTMLINFFGTKILTDPVLFENIGLYVFGFTYGPSRYSYPALKIDEIPKPDIILLSHAHMDHMDYKTLEYLTEKFPGQIHCITAFNTKDVIEDLDWRSLREMDWEEECNLEGIRFKALEVKHFGWRFPWERDRSKGYFHNGRSYNAYIIEKNNNKVLFGGDTALTDKFLSSAKEEIDIALMPIGAYNPWRMNHCNPEEALIMASVYVKAKYFIPMHCNTFKQGIEPIEEPLEWLGKSSSKYKINIGLSRIGETFTMSG
jgi:L-ascorbate metabolism protein UlaG (beta-lactamase superfamily)